MIKKLSLISLFTVLPASFYFAQTTVFAYLKDAEGKPVEKAQVSLKGEGNDVSADKIGYFQFVDLKTGHYQIVVSKSNFETKTLEFDITTEKRKDLGVITLYSTLTGADQGLAILDNAGDEDNGQSSTVGLLQSSQDVFNRIASFDLGAYWFRPRGVDGRTSENMLNGVSMVKSDNGNVDFSNWGGLNEIVRYPEISANHSPSEYAFGGATGVIYKNTRASEYRKGFQAVYSITNRNYRQRVSLRYSSGMSKSGWAFTLMGAKRWAEEGIQEGTFYDAYGTYLGVEKKFNDNHTMTFNAFASPYRRSTASPSTQEVYDYRGVHYNSYWGWQDGEKRSERVRKGFQPVFQLQDFWKINKKSNLWTSLSYQFGKDKGSRLDWQSVPNPSPTYYRNLPSYFGSLNPDAFVWNPETNDYLSAGDAYRTSKAAWESGDPNVTQINWNRLYAANIGQDPINQYGVTGKRALYYLVNDVSDDKIWNAATHYTYNFTDKTKFMLNVSYQNYRSELYREVNDLLGADFVLNKDPFAATNNPGTSALYNEGEANVAKKEGDRLLYNYIFRRQEVKVNPGLKFSEGKFDVFVSALAGYSTSSREGLFKHYLYADSFGKSKDYEFWNFGLKGQIIYKINGRNFLVYNGTYFSQAPYLEDLFINPRLNASVAPNIKNTVVNANDLSYVINSPLFKIRASVFLIDTQNETSVQRFFADGIQIDNSGAGGTTDTNTGGQYIQSAFVTQVMSNVEKRNLGAELGVDFKLLPTLSLQGVASYGEYTYRNNPNVYFASDAIGVFGNGQSFVQFGQSDLKNYKQGGTPQMAFSAGFRYSSPKYWWFGANWNYLDNNYLDPSALLRSQSFVQNSNSGTPYTGADDAELTRLLAPNKLPAAYFINANVGKSWMFGKYYLLISASVNNIFDNKNQSSVYYNENYTQELFNYFQRRTLYFGLQLRF